MRLCRCSAIVQDGKACPVCKPSKRTHAAFYSSNKWRQLSLRKRQADPICEQCLSEGRTEAATEVHHIVSVDESEDMRFEWDNLMSVCKACHLRLDGQAARMGGGYKVG